MLKAGEAGCAIAPLERHDRFRLRFTQRFKETVRSQTISQEKTRALTSAQSICLWHRSAR